MHDGAAGTALLFVDGQPASTIDAGPAVVGSGSLAVGRAAWNHEMGDFWNGSIDEVHA